jgi:Fic family protein
VRETSTINSRIHRRIVTKKNRVDRHRPLHPDLAKHLEERAIIEYTHSSNAIEGNTLTLGETETVIRGMTVGGKTIREIQEARNHPDAIQYLKQTVQNNIRITPDTIRHVHRLLLDKILEQPGDYRTGMIKVPGAQFTPPKSTEIPQHIQQLTDWLHANPMEYTPVELAARFTHRLLTIHPFHDGNGRTSRILLNIILMQHGYPVITNISYRDRKRYLESLREADLNNYEPLVNFIAKSVEESLTKHLVAIEELETYTLREATEHSPYTAAYLGLRAYDGALGAYKEGRNWRVTKEDLEAYIEEMQGKSKNQ